MNVFRYIAVAVSLLLVALAFAQQIQPGETYHKVPQSFIDDFRVVIDDPSWNPEPGNVVNESIINLAQEFEIDTTATAPIGQEFLLDLLLVPDETTGFFRAVPWDGDRTQLPNNSVLIPSATAWQSFQP